MPNGNGTGPTGAGPMTGRGEGYCAGTQAPGWRTPGGSGRMRGFHRNGAARGGFRCPGRAARQGSDPALEEQIDALQQQLAAIAARLAARKA